jgi:DnaJ-domain-containing protein 1
LDRFFDRLGDLVRSFLGEGSSRPSARRGANPYSDYDPDMQAAWEELEGYLRGEEVRTSRTTDAPPDLERERLRQDYANLEVPFGAPFEEVRRSYRRLLGRYHPDRNAGDPQRLAAATEITQKINVSYHRIEEFEESRRAR